MEIRIEGVGHRYGNLPVLDSIDLTVPAGETLALIGPSGCGKSTLLGIIGGLLQPTVGKVVAIGAPPGDCLNPFTYIFQDFALLPWRTVEQNVALPLEHHPLGDVARRQRVAEVLTLTGLTDFAAAFPKQLSGGMRQRVGIARAMVVHPAVLLLDEPLSALDAQTRELLMEEMLAIWRGQPTTRVYVTHNLDEALRLADRIAVLSRRPGRLREIVKIDLPIAQRADPTHAPYLAQLHQRLWSLMRDEALVADREVVNGEQPPSVTFRGGGFHYIPRRAIAWIAFAVVIALWQLLSSIGWLSPLALPSPRAIVMALWELLVSGKLLIHLGASLSRIVVGWLLGTAVGLTVGLAMGIFSTARSLGLPFVSALFPIPKIALLPLFIVWFGIGEPSKIAVIAFGVFFPTVISAFSACDNVPRNLIHMGQSFNLPGYAIVRDIILPGAMPGILSGFRISASIALILVVAAEMIGAQQGIGAFVLAAGNLMQTDQLLAGVVMLSILGLLIAFLLGRIETWVLRWR